MISKRALPVFLFLFALAACPAQQTPKPALPAAAPPIPLVAETPITEPPAPTESWTKLALKESGLPAGTPEAVTLSNNDLPEGCNRELLEMKWRALDPIDVYVIRPAGVAKPPVGLFLLNYTFDTAVFRNPYWCTQAKENQIAIVGFGSALSVQRFHAPRPMKQWFVSELQESLATSTHDVQMILNYLQTRGDLDGRHVGLYGQGSGGAVGILAAAVDPRITALQVVDPWGDWPEWIKASAQIPADERASYLKPEFLSGVADLDPVKYLPQLKLRALRVQQVMSDPVTPAEAKEAMAKAAPKAEDVIRFDNNEAQHKAVFLGGVSEWLAGRLHDAEAAKYRVAEAGQHTNQELAR